MDRRLVAANEAFKQGRKSEAVDIIVAALSDGLPPEVPFFPVLLRNLLELKRYGEGVTWAEKALELAPNEYQFINYLGVFLRRTDRQEEAVAMFDRALELNPRDVAALINKGNALNDIEAGARAEAVFNKLIRREPNQSEHHRGLGRALLHQRNFDAALTRMRRALSLDKDNENAWLDQSSILVEIGDLPQALASIESALARLPDADRLSRLKARILRQIGKVEASEQFLYSLRERFDGAAWYHHELGRLVSEVDRTRANEHYRRAFELDPDDVENRLALAEGLDRNRQNDEAASIEQAYALIKAAPPAKSLDPRWAKVTAEIYARSADYDAVSALGGFSELGRAWATNGYHTALLGHLPRVRTPADRHELIDQHRLWGDLARERAERNPIERPAKVRSDTKIRIGFMSSDLRDHPVTYFAWPLFEHLDRSRFEIHCYSFYRTPQPTAILTKLAMMVDSFRCEPFISDHDAAQMIANDDLDILFELGGSTHMNKLDVMAWKPARLGASWLGYPHSAGLDTIDYLLVDPYLNPPDPRLLIEKPLIMPHSWIAMSEQAFPDTHAINPVAPVRRNGFVTFGTANNPYKYSADMLRTWARAVAAVPNARFIFVRPEGGAPSFTRNVTAYFEEEGVSADRIDFRAVRSVHIPHYNDIDIALDTFPQTGGTTTCEAAWMGVPTVTLVGEALFERLSYSILRNAGLDDLCATTTEAFVDIAVRLANDPDRIQQLRTGLRDQIRAGPLGQTRQFAQDFYDLVARTVEADRQARPR